MRLKTSKKIILVFLVASIWASLVFFTSSQTTELPEFQKQWIQHRLNHPILMGLIFFILYFITTGLSLPIASPLTLLAGAIFGFWKGLVLVSFASSLGATFAFWVSRYFLRDWVQQRFKNQFTLINERFQKEGAYYLFGLRLSPIFPFFAVNLIMGLTSIRAGVFYWVSQIAMLPGTALYVNAGDQLASVDSLKKVVSLPIILSLTLLGLFPLLMKRILKK